MLKRKCIAIILATNLLIVTRKELCICSVFVYSQFSWIHKWCDCTQMVYKYTRMVPNWFVYPIRRCMYNVYTQIRFVYGQSIHKWYTNHLCMLVVVINLWFRRFVSIYDIYTQIVWKKLYSRLVIIFSFYSSFNKNYFHSRFYQNN